MSIVALAVLFGLAFWVGMAILLAAQPRFNRLHLFELPALTVSLGVCAWVLFSLVGYVVHLGLITVVIAYMAFGAVLIAWAILTGRAGLISIEMRLTLADWFVLTFVAALVPALFLIGSWPQSSSDSMTTVALVRRVLTGAAMDINRFELGIWSHSLAKLGYQYNGLMSWYATGSLLTGVDPAAIYLRLPALMLILFASSFYVVCRRIGLVRLAAPLAVGLYLLEMVACHAIHWLKPTIGSPVSYRSLGYPNQWGGIPLLVLSGLLYQRTEGDRLTWPVVMLFGMAFASLMFIHLGWFGWSMVVVAAMGLARLLRGQWGLFFDHLKVALVSIAFWLVVTILFYQGYAQISRMNAVPLESWIYRLAWGFAYDPLVVFSASRPSVYYLVGAVVALLTWFFLRRRVNEVNPLLMPAAIVIMVAVSLINPIVVPVLTKFVSLFYLLRLFGLMNIFGMVLLAGMAGLLLTRLFGLAVSGGSAGVLTLKAAALLDKFGFTMIGTRPVALFKRVRPVLMVLLTVAVAGVGWHLGAQTADKDLRPRWVIRVFDPAVSRSLGPGLRDGLYSIPYRLLLQTIPDRTVFCSDSYQVSRFFTAFKDVRAVSPYLDKRWSDARIKRYLACRRVAYVVLTPRASRELTPRLLRYPRLLTKVFDDVIAEYEILGLKARRGVISRWLKGLLLFTSIIDKLVIEWKMGSGRFVVFKVNTARLRAIYPDCKPRARPR
jgi:hypothetical protein